MTMQKTATYSHYDVEMTDTYGGEANYCWVTRKAVPVTDDLTDLKLVRRAKNILGISGLRGVTENYGDMIKFKPYKLCIVAFIRYCDNPKCIHLDTDSD